MVLPAVFLIHSAVLSGRKQNFVLEYDNGTAVFTAGKTLTGATSHATAVIVSTGSIASGSLFLHTINGTFLDSEVITDNGTVPGAALVNGTIAEAFDINGELIYTDIITSVSCRFVGPQESMRMSGQSIPYIMSTSKVLLPAGTPVSEGDIIASNTLGFDGSYKINSVKQVYEAAQAAVSHISCELAAAGSTGGA